MENLLEETKRILKEQHMHANKSLGQNFLTNENIIHKMIEAAKVNREDLVIEIGPGLGSLTKYLLEEAGRVFCVELDPAMVLLLQQRFIAYSNLDIIQEDILKLDLKTRIQEYLVEFPELKNVKVVANLPYYITTPIIMKLLEDKLPIESITVMLQKEVAKRLTQIPGGKDCGAITYAIYYYTIPEEIIEVSKEEFLPSPEVDSEVIMLQKRESPAVLVKEEEILFTLIKVAFMQRRKTLLNALANSHVFNDKQEIKGMLEKLNIPANIRAEKLSLEEFAKMADYVQKIGIRKKEH